MTISLPIIVGQFAAGNPGSLGEPLGLWVGTAVVTGDASGGFLGVFFEPQNPTTTPTLPDQRLQFVYFVDGVRITCDQDPGNVSMHIQMHMDRANAALATPFTRTEGSDMLAGGFSFQPARSLMTPEISRMPIFWRPEELASGTNLIVQLACENNVNLANYRFEAYGRYYDKQVLANRAFGRLISPPAISQFA